ncbi:MAG: hypothetical protein QOE97_330 [Pseudonocardiales bacterium]|nr:hypothetical protein [Pseudonocardiales bacterium]
MVRLPPRLRPLFPYLKPVYVRATGLLAPGTRRLSRARDGWLPTGVVDTVETAAATSGGRAEVARPAELLDRPPRPTGLPPDLAVTDPGDSLNVPRVAAAELPDGRVLGPHRAIVTGRGDLLQELSRYFGTRRPLEHPLFLNPFPPQPLEVPGRLGVLASRGDGNYYHFLHDVLPRLAVLEATSIAAPDRWYVPATARFQRELLDLVGITEDRRIDADRHPHVRAGCLVVPGVPAMTEKNPPWVGAFLRERLLDPSLGERPRARVYVTRGPSANNRTVVNDDEVGALLAERGFVTVDPGAQSVREQIETFATASVIVATHGAALANLVFASFGTSVIELFPAGCLLPDYWRMACGVPGMSYRYLSSTGGPSRPTRAQTIVRDIEVDIRALRRLLDEAGATEQ